MKLISFGEIKGRELEIDKIADGVWSQDKEVPEERII